MVTPPVVPVRMTMFACTAESYSSGDEGRDPSIMCIRCFCWAVVFLKPRVERRGVRRRESRVILLVDAMALTNVIGQFMLFLLCCSSRFGQMAA